MNGQLFLNRFRRTSCYLSLSSLLESERKLQRTWFQRWLSWSNGKENFEGGATRKRILKPISSKLKTSKALRNTQNEEHWMKTKFGLDEYAIEKIRTSHLPGDNPQEDWDEIDEDDVREISERGHEFYDIYKMEERSHRKFVHRKIRIRKNIKGVQEPTLISWLEREQIIFLNNLDSEEFNPEQLACCYPISQSGIKKVLSNQQQVKSAKGKLLYDKTVNENWKLVLSGQLNADHLVHWRKEKPTEDLLNFVPSKETDARGLASSLPSTTSGEFMAIIKPFLKEPIKPIILPEEQKLKYTKMNDTKSNWISVTTGSVDTSLERQDPLVPEVQKFKSCTRNNNESESIAKPTTAEINNLPEEHRFNFKYKQIEDAKANNWMPVTNKNYNSVPIHESLENDKINNNNLWENEFSRKISKLAKIWFQKNAKSENPPRYLNQKVRKYISVELPPKINKS